MEGNSAPLGNLHQLLSLVKVCLVDISKAEPETFVKPIEMVQNVINALFKVESVH